MIDRRLFLLSGLAACSIPADDGSDAGANAQARLAPAAGAPVLSPEQFGARGDGRSDDTPALQACMDRAPPGGVVRLRRGAVYRIDTNRNPSWSQFGGLSMRPRVTLDLNRAELRALPSAQPRGAVVQAARVAGWRIVGPGRIVGERAIHRGREGEWGMGLAAFASDRWVVEGVEIMGCWGDGLYVGAPGTAGEFCHNFLIDRVEVSDCRRNGISIIAGRDGEIRGATIRKINGISPVGGIDLEPDFPAHPNRNIIIRGGSTRNVGVGVYVTVGNENVLITGMDIEGDNSGIIIGDNVAGLRIEDNLRIVSMIGGEEGAALRTVVANPSSVRGVSIRRNLLAGGGHFVIDVVGDGYRDLVIAQNRIQATNRGVQGIGRIGGGAFTDNETVIGAAAGKANDYFLTLSNVAYGRNSYRNLSPHSMHNVIFDGRDLGGDRYLSASLRAWHERR